MLCSHYMLFTFSPRPNRTERIEIKTNAHTPSISFWVLTHDDWRYSSHKYRYSERVIKTKDNFPCTDTLLGDTHRNWFDRCECTKKYQIFVNLNVCIVQPFLYYCVYELGIINQTKVLDFHSETHQLIFFSFLFFWQSGYSAAIFVLLTNEGFTCTQFNQLHYK